jgi:hypothetical protein
MFGTGDRFRQVHVGALALAAIMLPWSEYLLSNAQFLLIGNWLVEGLVRKDLTGRFKRAFTHPAGLVFLSFFALHALGLLWTEDMAWGLDLCRILLPVLAFTPILVSTPPLSPRELRMVLLLGAWSTLASTLVCLGLMHDVIGQGGYRELSIFISHIRLALLLCFSIAVFALIRPRTAWARVAHGLAIGWCAFFLDRLSSLPGFAILALMGAYGLWRWTAGRGTVMRWAVRSILVLAPLVAAGYARWCVKEFFREDGTDLSRLDERSAGGERYYHDRVQPLHENGHYVWINVADGELQRAWARRSRRPYLHVDSKGQPLRYTLIRYMASMGLRKDSIGALSLSDQDVRRVESGVPSVVVGRRDPVRARIDQVLFEWEHYRAVRDASGHSVAMRYEFLRTGWAIAKANMLFGAGTGDTRPAFAAEYERQRTSLRGQWRLRAHNEYLTLWISFGIIGLLWSLFSWIWPAWRMGAFHRPLFLCWAIIFAVSCLSEDTIETQMGATFFAFFYTLLVFAYPIGTLNAPAVRSPSRD